MSLTPEQIATRRTGVTSTDASAIVGLNPYKSALEVYSAKVGEGPVVADNEAMWWGREEEPLLMRRYAAMTGHQAFPWQETVRGPEPWMLATPDGWVIPDVGEGWLYEGKTVWSYEQVKRWGDAEDRMPWEYIVQCQWGMNVTGKRRCDVMVRLATAHGPESRIYTLHYDDRRIMTHPERGVIARCRRFWFENVQKGIPPEPDGSPSASAAIAAMYPDADLDVKFAMSGSEQDALEDYRGALADKKLAEQAEAEARQKLEMLIGDAEGIEHPEIGTVLWKAGKSGKRRWNSRGLRV